MVKLGKVRGGPRRIFGSPLFFTWNYLLFIGGVGESFSGVDLAFGKGNGNGKRRSRFPEGMTERKARAKERATAEAKEEADSRRE